LPAISVSGVVMMSLTDLEGKTKGVNQELLELARVLAQ
jgi:hypothetical protein